MAPYAKMRLFVDIEIYRGKYIYRRKYPQGKRQPKKIKRKERKGQAFVGDKKAYSEGVDREELKIPS
jgi:hypothetical protein